MTCRYVLGSDPRLERLKPFAHSPVTWFRNPFALLIVVRARLLALRLASAWHPLVSACLGFICTSKSGLSVGLCPGWKASCIHAHGSARLGGWKKNLFGYSVDRDSCGATKASVVGYERDSRGVQKAATRSAPDGCHPRASKNKRSLGHCPSLCKFPNATEEVKGVGRNPCW